MLATSMSYGVLKPDKYDGADGIPLVRILDIESGNVAEHQLDHISPAQSREFSRTILATGDLICSVVGTLGETFVVPSSLQGANLSRALARIQLTPETDTRYIQYCIAAPQFSQFVDLNTEGAAQKVLNLGTLSELPIPIRENGLQSQIANFLDEQTARIDALIAEKERLVQSLDELREATCRSALTRGLVSKTQLVESGAQFLGEIPAHWKVLPWKRLGHFTGGAGFPIEYQGITTEELPFFKVKDLDAADLLHPLTETDNTVSRETATKLRANVFPVGTLTFAKVGAALLLLRVRRLGVPGCLDNNMMAFISDEAVVDPLFAQLALGLLPLDWLVNPGAVPSVSASQVGEVKVALPSLDEQRQIAEYVQSKSSEFAGVRSHLREHIGRLREYRSSLISSAVTGQLDLSTFKAAA